MRTLKSLSLTVGCVLALASLVGVAFASSDGTTPNGPDQGTRLSIVTVVPSVSCIDTTAGVVSIDFTVLSSQAAADSAELTVFIDDVEFWFDTIASGNVTDGGGWFFNKRTKTAVGEVDLYLGNGIYEVAICATQSGAGGREPKQTCGEPTTVKVACDTAPENACSGAFFGSVTSNRNLCLAQGTIQVHFKADYGPSASLTITGPGGFTYTDTLARAGESCNYHYNWTPPADADAGYYTFTASPAGDDSETTVFTTRLRCN